MERKFGELSLDINKIAHSLRMSASMLEPLSGDCCIYRVPPDLYSLNREAYTPKLVSIGPFHHGKIELKLMESHKLRYLCTFLERLRMTMEEFIEGLKELELSLHQSYVEIDGYDREKFIEIIAVDGAFVMQLLLMYYYEEFPVNDRIFGRQRLFSNLKYDLLLMENQLPFFYLKYLFSLYKKSGKIDERITLMKVVQDFLSEEATPWKWSVTNDIVAEERQVHHLLHFLIICLWQSGSNEARKCTSLSTPTISELHRAGVKFKPSSTFCLSSVGFANGIMEIPKLRLTDDAEMIFRNMQAFEHCHKLGYYVRDYIYIMDALINNEEDMKVLIQSGIVENWLEDNHVAASVFNNLNKGNCINSNEFSYARVTEDLNAYYKIRRHRWKATLKQKYFRNPWTIISVVAAAFLLVLTTIQTVCSILQVA